MASRPDNPWGNHPDNHPDSRMVSPWDNSARPPNRKANGPRRRRGRTTITAGATISAHPVSTADPVRAAEPVSTAGPDNVEREARQASRPPRLIGAAGHH